MHFSKKISVASLYLSSYAAAAELDVSKNTDSAIVSNGVELDNSYPDIFFEPMSSSAQADSTGSEPTQSISITYSTDVPKVESNATHHSGASSDSGIFPPVISPEGMGSTSPSMFGGDAAQNVEPIASSLSFSGNVTNSELPTSTIVVPQYTAPVGLAGVNTSSTAIVDPVTYTVAPTYIPSSLDHAAETSHSFKTSNISITYPTAEKSSFAATSNLSSTVFASPSSKDTGAEFTSHASSIVTKTVCTGAAETHCPYSPHDSSESTGAKPPATGAASNYAVQSSVLFGLAVAGAAVLFM